MSRIVVDHVEKDRYRIAVRGHEIWVDQPVEDGGDDSAPTPTELFVAGLVSCVAHYAGRFLRRHGLAEDGLAVDAEFGFAPDRPARVDRVSIRVRTPASFPAARRSALLAVIEHCTVHNSIQLTPDISFDLQVAREAA